MNSPAKTDLLIEGILVFRNQWKMTLGKMNPI